MGMEKHTTKLFGSTCMARHYKGTGSKSLNQKLFQISPYTCTVYIVHIHVIICIYPLGCDLQECWVGSCSLTVTNPKHKGNHSNTCSGNTSQAKPDPYRCVALRRTCTLYAYLYKYSLEWGNTVLMYIDKDM